MIYEQAFHDAQAHALEVFPQESCGLIVKGAYVRCENVHETPLEAFKIASDVMIRYRGQIDMIVHSHPNGPYFPSTADMQSQLSTAVPWAIIATDGERAGVPIMWGDQLEMAPLIGREFMHGVWDCYSAIRDTFRLGKDKLAEQDISHQWPFDPIVLPEVPREDGWWNKGEDLYQDLFAKFGFVEIQLADARAGDVFLTTISGDTLSHGGLLVEDDLLLHHLPTRLSRREAASIWARSAKKWIRYVGEGSIYA